MKNPNDAMGNRTRDLSARSEVPEPTVSLRAASFRISTSNHAHVPSRLS